MRSYLRENWLPLAVIVVVATTFSILIASVLPEGRRQEALLLAARLKACTNVAPHAHPVRMDDYRFQACVDDRSNVVVKTVLVPDIQ